MILVTNLVLGGITPPVGMLLFIVAGIQKTPINKVIRHIWPFIAVVLISTVIMIFWPAVTLFLPRLFYR
jgi:TRAP-type C4-dicarboxylate transport system permease large subunit